MKAQRLGARTPEVIETLMRQNFLLRSALAALLDSLEEHQSTAEDTRKVLSAAVQSVGPIRSPARKEKKP